MSARLRGALQILIAHLSNSIALTARQFDTRGFANNPEFILAQSAFTNTYSVYAFQVASNEYICAS
jgi:predicted GNAT family N-acyltransferase